MGGALQQSPLLIPGQEGGTVRSGCQIRNQRGRKPPPTNIRDFRCPGEGRGRGRHLGEIQGPGGKAGGCAPAQQANNSLCEIPPLPH